MSQKIVNNLFHYAKQIEAENIVLNTDDKEIKISYYLKDGQVAEFFLARKYLSELKKNLKLKLKTKSLIAGRELDIVKKEAKFKDGDLAMDFLLSFISLGGDEKIVIDCKDVDHKKWRLSELGLKLEDRKKLLKTIEKEQGLIIISGEKNSGKSTTLLALLKEISGLNRTSCLLTNTKPDFDFIKMEINKNSFEVVRKSDIDIIAIDEVETRNHLEHALRLASYGKLVVVSIEAKNFKDLAKKIKSSNWPKKDQLIKIISFQKLVKLKPSLIKKESKRRKIARFKLLNFSEKNA